MKTTKIKQGFILVALTCLTMTVTSQTTDELKAKIISLNKEIGQAVIDGNTQKSLSFYTEDAISMPDNSKMLQGIEAIKKSSEEMAASGVKVKSFEINTLMVNTCENNIAEIGSFKMSLSIPGMPNLAEEVGKYLTLWEKQADGSLKIKLEIWNSDTNPMAQQ